ncbi:uncharacterized protein LOC123209809 [Mangifera indica]|uniref:uncharacterized protein LOC123209809 n=1 Tax=Mangifera indica TaxID=29780 RepID=UPI001CFB258C|nr:uncharacterized protein LOC123209809 [Mangifera indica]
MPRRELSSTLKNLKFMQRTVHRDEKINKEEEAKPDGNFIFPGEVERKCVVIMEGDPHPGAIVGRMSFQSFNPSIDKLNEATNNLFQTEASASCSGNQTVRNSERENGSSQDGAGCLKVRPPGEGNIDLKRKQSEKQYSNKSLKIVEAGSKSSRSNHKGSHNQPRRDKVDWSVLRPPKFPSNKSELKQ